jgi:hypothetical protein
VVLEALLLGIARTVVSVIRLLSDSWTARRRGPSERLRHLLRTKKEVAERLPAILSQTNGEAIIRELRRKDTYPDIDDSLRGISPWFKLELKGTYHRGIEVPLGSGGAHRRQGRTPSSLSAFRRSGPGAKPRPRTT